MSNLICEQQVLLSRRFVNVITDWIWEQQVLSRWDKPHHHINIMHRDTRYKWKPIKGENHILLLLWCKGKLQLPLTTVFLQAPTYKRLQPQFCKLQLARKHQLPSIFCRHQPTGGSNLSQLQLTTIKLQLDREAPTSSFSKTECLLIYLRYQLCSVASLNLLCLLYSAFSLYMLSPLLQKKTTLHINMILFIDFLTWLFVFCLEFEMESHVSLPSAFSLLLSAYSEIITVGVNFNITVGVCFLSETCQCITNNKNN